MQARGLGEVAEIEAHIGLVGVGDVVLVLLELVLDEARLEAPVGNGRHHGVGNVADAAEAGGLERQFGRRDIDPHAADHDGHQFTATQTQAEVIHTFHCRSSKAAFAGTSGASGDIGPKAAMISDSRGRRLDPMGEASQVSST